MVWGYVWMLAQFDGLNDSRFACGGLTFHCSFIVSAACLPLCVCEAAILNYKRHFSCFYTLMHFKHISEHTVVNTSSFWNKQTLQNAKKPLSAARTVPSYNRTHTVDALNLCLVCVCVCVPACVCVCVCVCVSLSLSLSQLYCSAASNLTVLH